MPDADVSSVLVRPCPEPKFGDYQSNALMGLAKRNQLNPTNSPPKSSSNSTSPTAASRSRSPGRVFSISGSRPTPSPMPSSAQPGRASFYRTAAEPRTIVIDYSSPNVAKPMHVGHIRSTILGDTLAKAFRLLGHSVVTDNHIGDWGTQFGKLLVGWKEHLDRDALGRDALAEMERLYKLTNSACEEDEIVLIRARSELVKLQSGDAENLAIWDEMIELSRHQFDEIYGRLGVDFDETLGESFYNDRLKGVVDELVTQGIAEESDGAQVVFLITTSRSRNTRPSSRKATAQPTTPRPTSRRSSTGKTVGSRARSFTSPTAGSNCTSSNSSSCTTAGNRATA